MTILMATYDLTLPLTNPVLKFFLILVIILFAPIIFNKLRIPYLLGLIIAGAIVGPHGFNLMVRDSSIILSGTAGLLYIMFLAGLEIEMADFKKHSGKSTVLGLYGFSIPMVIGTFTGIWILGYSTATSVLLASMFASHTLMTYPVVSKLGILKNKAVSISVSSTLITNTLALLVLAVIVGAYSGELSTIFWIRLIISILIAGSIIILLFPVIGRWFFKRYDDPVSQYIFVLVMVFFGAVLAQLAGIEAIIGAFLAGLSINKLVPRTSPLMNRIGFVGNAIFIPFFLISVGMLIDYREFFSHPETIRVAIVMTVVATTGKYLAAWLTQKNFRFSADERRIIFGLTNSQAAATLAAVMVGYNIITGYTDTGEPIRLLNEAILNGTIIMILVTCTIASFETQRGATRIALLESAGIDTEIEDKNENILLPVSNPDTAEELTNLSLIIKSRENRSHIHALSIISSPGTDIAAEKRAAKIIEKVVATGAAADTYINQLLRYDTNVVNGISGVVRENQITDIILGLHQKKGISESFLGNLTEGILTCCNTNTLVYKPTQPISTIKRHMVFIPPNAEKEPGFPFWLARVWNIGRNTATPMIFFAQEKTLSLLRQVHDKHHIEATFTDHHRWDQFLAINPEVQPDDNIIIVLSRRHKPSYHYIMEKIPLYLNEYLRQNSFILIYPVQSGIDGNDGIDYNNPSLLKSIRKVDEIGLTLATIFQKKENQPE